MSKESSTATSRNRDMSLIEIPSKFSLAQTNSEFMQDSYAIACSTNSIPTTFKPERPVDTQETISGGSDNEEIVLFRGRKQTRQSNQISPPASYVQRDAFALQDLPHRSSSQRSKTSNDHQENIVASRRSHPMELQNSFSKRALDVSAKPGVASNNAFADYIENIGQGNLTDLSDESIPLQPPQINTDKSSFNVNENPLPSKPPSATTKFRLGENIWEDFVGIDHPAQFDPPSSVSKEDQVARYPADNPEGGHDNSVVSSLHNNRMTDEEIAKRLAKQEELGLGSAEMLLFDGTDDVVGSDDDLGDPDLAFLRNEAKQYVLHSKGDTDRSSRSLLSALDDWSSGAEGDQYGEFDVLDTERPSLQVFGGTRSRKWSELVDFGMGPEMILAWEKDRLKKGAKKKEREILRAQGLLGGGTGNAMKAKYPEGMVWDSIRDELKAFLLSNQQT